MLLSVDKSKSGNRVNSLDKNISLERKGSDQNYHSEIKVRYSTRQLLTIFKSLGRF